jgi:hypothetical protein
MGDRFLNWHDLIAWRYFELATLLAVCFLIYALVLQLLPGRRIAAFFAALYFTCVPTIFAPLHELFAFDFLHIVFTLACVIAFIAGYRATGIRRWGWTAASWIAFLIALTCKEITVVIPVFLVFASVILLIYEPLIMARRRALVHETIRLAPFWGLLPIYWFLHVRWISPPDATGQTYRLGANWPVILENAAKYPLWLARIYGITPDRLQQAVGYINARNLAIGAALLLLLVVGWIRVWRKDVKYRELGWFACAWIGAFLIVPVYSGGLFWHGNLALCGYCMLFGAATEWGLQLLTWRVARGVVAIVLVAGAIALTRVDAAKGLTSDQFAMVHRINATVLTKPPVPLGRVSGDALVYVENRFDVAAWGFGATRLFNLVYQDAELQQVLVPRMDHIERDALKRWLEQSNAFFFRYDDEFHWHDATDEFRRFAKANELAVAAPLIICTNPAEVHAGVGFNVQPGAISAVGVDGESFRRGSVILVNGIKTPAGFASSESIAGAVPDAAFSHPGTITIQVQNPDGQVSNAVQLRVRK